MNLLSAFCRKQMIWNLRRRSGSGLPPGIRRFSGGAKTDKVGQALCLPSQMGGIRSPAGPPFSCGSHPQRRKNARVQSP